MTTAESWALPADVVLSRIIPYALCAIERLNECYEDNVVYTDALFKMRSVCRRFRDHPAIRVGWEDVFSQAIMKFSLLEETNSRWFWAGGKFAARSRAYTPEVHKNMRVRFNAEKQITELTLSISCYGGGILPDYDYYAPPGMRTGWSSGEWCKLVGVGMGQCRPDAQFILVDDGVTTEQLSEWYPTDIQQRLNRVIIRRGELCRWFSGYFTPAFQPQETYIVPCAATIPASFDSRGSSNLEIYERVERTSSPPPLKKRRG